MYLSNLSLLILNHCNPQITLTRTLQNEPFEFNQEQIKVQKDHDLEQAKRQEEKNVDAIQFMLKQQDSRIKTEAAFDAIFNCPNAGKANLFERVEQPKINPFDDLLSFEITTDSSNSTSVGNSIIGLNDKPLVDQPVKQSNYAAILSLYNNASVTPRSAVVANPFNFNYSAVQVRFGLIHLEFFFCSKQ